jgi:hypothetical protein
MKKVRYDKSVPLLSLIAPPCMYAKYHVCWGTSHGVVGKVIGVDIVNKTVMMESPSSGVKWKNPVKWSDLRHLRSTQTKIQSQ